MVLTLFLLGLVYVVFVAVLLAAGTGVAAMAIIIAALVLAQLFLSDKIALAAMGAKEVSAEQAPELHAIIERLCIQADLPKPKVAIADTPMPNAFAMGRSPKKAVVCATTGILNTLAPHELEGVLAHELSHVKHRDVLVMTLASFFASVAAMLTQFGIFFGGGDDRDSGLPFVVVLLVSFAVYLISYLLMNTLSRYREFAADRTGALITGRPSALASALLRISGQMQRIPEQDLRSAGQMNAFFIVPASVKTGVQTLLSTHPSMEKRIQRLEQLEAQLQGTA